jgi:hypothetical protein
VTNSGTHHLRLIRTVAAAVVYTACDRKKSQMELAEAALIIEVAIQSRYREILGALKLPLREWPLP